jgi:hypothetical protein
LQNTPCKADFSRLGARSEGAGSHFWHATVSELRDHSRSLGHVPLIDHNPRRGTKIEFSPAEAIRDNERTAAERSNARLKDEFGGKNLRVRGDTKVMAHLMFGILALSADQLMRLRQ